jgi:hypothetical protein
MRPLIRSNVWRQNSIPDFIRNDITFRRRASYYNNNAIFKKTSTNSSGTIAFPKAEAEALDLKLTDLVNIAVFRLNFNERYDLRAVNLNKNRDGFFSFTFPKDKADENNLPREDLAPAVFVASKVGGPGSDIIESVRNLLRRRDRYTSGNVMLWKQRVRIDKNGDEYVTIEPNERDYFGISPGDQINITTLPLESGERFRVVDLIGNFGLRTTVRRNAVGDANSVKIYIDELVRNIGYSEGTLIQCIAVPQ